MILFILIHEYNMLITHFPMLLMFKGTFCSRQNRETNSIGTACTELEHCVSDFDHQTGDCPGNQCEPGWMGPGCQYGKWMDGRIDR